MSNIGNVQFPAIQQQHKQYLFANIKYKCHNMSNLRQKENTQWKHTQTDTQLNNP